MSIPRRFLFLLLALWCVTALPVAAAVDLYVAEGPVADESNDTRNAALSGLLADVVMRVSGSTAMANQPAAKPVLAAAPALAQQYRYRTVDQDGELVRYLWARFDPAAVDRSMREHGLPVWTQRPRVVLWLAAERAGQRALLNLDTQPDARTAMQQRADYRGLPLQLPLMDLEDQNQLSAADLWSDYQPAIRQASARYPHEVAVSGRLTARAGDVYSGRWQIVGQDDTQTFDTPALPLSEALVFAVDQIQNLLAARYAPTAGTGSGDETLVAIGGVTDLAGYGRVLGLLERLDAVAQVALRDVSGDRFTFALRLRGARADLQRALGNATGLAVEPASVIPPPRDAADTVPGDASVDVARPVADLSYRLLD